METTTKQNTAIGSIALLAVLSLILGLGGGIDAGNWYFGIDNESNIICGPIQCDKLSSQNTDGISTRCYFFSEDLNRTTYKTCKTGWIKFEQPKEEIITPSEGEIYLRCFKTETGLIHECQVIDKNQTIYKVENS